MGQVDGSQLHWVLVHGSMHGAWSYYKTMALLQAEGYKVTAVDLAGCGASAVDSNTVSDFEVFNQPLVDVLNAIPATERVVLVGHSLGSISLLHAMENFTHKISLAIHVAGALLPSGVSFDITGDYFKGCFPLIGPFQIFARQIFGNGPENPPTTITIDKANLQKVFYTSPKTPSADLALAQIMCRPASFEVQFSTVVHYTKEKQGTIPSVYIKTSIDQCLPPASQDYIIKACPQTEVVEIHADHTPMFSATDELHEILLRLAAKYTSA
ncbi:hypothetical protein BDL97_13G127800 [Sphagnum fallax]|nr:hypothetical protein BDL97_13G127800 [Sphagnum fallax]